MDYFLKLLFLIISITIGTILCLFLNIKSYIIIAIVSTTIFISIELYYNYNQLTTNTNILDNNTPFDTNLLYNIPNLTLTANGTLLSSESLPTIMTPSQLTITPSQPMPTLPSTMTPSQLNTILPSTMTLSQLTTTPSQPMPTLPSAMTLSQLNTTLPQTTQAQLATQQAMIQTKYDVKVGGNVDVSGIVDGKDMAIVNNSDVMEKPPFDGLMPQELNSRLQYIYYATSHPEKVINYNDYITHADKEYTKDNITQGTTASIFYPFLTKNQINGHDCMNFGNNGCFQNANFTFLDKGVNLDNANLILHEDFTQNVVCNHCKLAMCKNNYCGKQNKLFM